MAANLVLLYLIIKDDSRVWNTIHRSTYAMVSKRQTIPAKKTWSKIIALPDGSTREKDWVLCFSLQNGTRHYQHPDDFNSLSIMSMLVCHMGHPFFKVIHCCGYSNHWKSCPASIKVVITSPFPAPGGQVKLPPDFRK